MKKSGFQSSNVLTISLAHLVHDIFSSFLAPILPLLIEKLGISYSLAGLLSVMQRIPSMLNPIIGLIADKLSVRYFLIISPAVTAIVMSSLGIAPHYSVLAILLFTMGLSAALFHVPGPVMIKHLSGNRIGKGMSFYMLGGELARTLGPLTILGAVSLWGLEGTYNLIPFGVAASILIYIKLRKIEIRQNLNRDNRQHGISDTIKKLLPFFTIIVGITFCRAIMKSALTTFLPTYLNVKGASLWMGGISLSILQFTGAAGTLLSGSISDKIGRKTTLLVIAIITPILMALFISLQGILTIPILVVIGFFMFANQPVLLALVQEINLDRPAFVNGIYMMINFVVTALTAVLIGVLGDWIGLENTYKLSAVLALGGIFFVLMLPGKNTHRSQ